MRAQVGQQGLYNHRLYRLNFLLIRIGYLNLHLHCQCSIHHLLSDVSWSIWQLRDGIDDTWCFQWSHYRSLSFAGSFTWSFKGFKYCGHPGASCEDNWTGRAYTPCEANLFVLLNPAPPATVLFLAQMYMFVVCVCVCVCVSIAFFDFPTSHGCLSQSDGEANDSDDVTPPAELVSAPIGDNSAVTAERWATSCLACRKHQCHLYFLKKKIK